VSLLPPFGRETTHVASRCVRAAKKPPGPKSASVDVGLAL
jgi:hypothetical protein